MIHCDNCKSINPPEGQTCQNCGKTLLPGTGIAARIGMLIVSLGVAVFGIWILVGYFQGKDVILNLGCALSSPFFWMLLVAVMTVSGFSFALKGTALYNRYLERGKRHVGLDQKQALADFTKALELAPEKNRAPILKERAILLERMGRAEEATRDKIAELNDKNAYETITGAAALAGVDKDALIDNEKLQKEEELLRSRKAVALGFCMKCKTAVRLDEQKHCGQHPNARILEKRLAVPADVELVLDAIIEDQTHEDRRTRIRRILMIIGSVLLCVVLTYFLNKG